jgi:hypothetical protein
MVGRSAMRPWRRIPQREVRVAAAFVLAAIAGAGASTLMAQTSALPPKACGTHVGVAKLLDTFHSCARVEDVRKEIRSRGLQWEVMGDRVPTTTRLSMAKVANFTNLGATGELRLLFFRDRLMQMQFAPPDLREYWERLVRTEGLQVAAAGADRAVVRARAGDRVEVWLNTHPDHRYVGWRDERLEREFSDHND